MKHWAAHLLTLLGILATLLVGFVTYKATYDLSERGSIPPKRLEATYYPALDPLAALGNPEAGLTVNIRNGNDVIRNVAVIQTTLENKGSSPVLPSEMIEPLRLISTPTWRIINVVNANDQLEIRWTRRSDTEFTSSPFLLNPGDKIIVIAYLTYQGPRPITEGPSVSWSARIVNLRQIDTAQNPFADEIPLSQFVAVILFDWAVPFLIMSFIIYFGLSLILMARAGLVQPSSPSSVLSILTVSLINLCASEAGAYYVFDLPPGFIVVPGNTLNVVGLGLNGVLLISLSILARRHAKARGAKGPA